MPSRAIPTAYAHEIDGQIVSEWIANPPEGKSLGLSDESKRGQIEPFGSVEFEATRIAREKQHTGEAFDREAYLTAERARRTKLAADLRDGKRQEADLSLSERETLRWETIHKEREARTEPTRTREEPTGR